MLEAAKTPREILIPESQSSNFFVQIGTKSLIDTWTNLVQGRHLGDKFFFQLNLKELKRHFIMTELKNLSLTK